MKVTKLRGIDKRIRSVDHSLSVVTLKWTGLMADQGV